VSDLRSWSEEGASDEELRLLTSSRGDRPDQAARLRTLLALGIGGPPEGGPASGAPGVGRLGARAKLALLGVVGGGLVAGVLWLAAGHRAGDLHIGATTSIATPSGSAEARPPEPEVVPLGAPAPVDLAARAAVAPAAGHRTGARPTTPAREVQRARSEATPRAAEPGEPSTLAAEVAALELAHDALTRRDAEGALRALDGYRARFPAGRLTSEETVLRVQALLARGDRAGAVALTDAFTAAHPGSSYGSRMRDLVHGALENQKNE
jgi:hypothetical protein